MEIELYLIKLENRKKENRLTWDYIIQCTIRNIKVTSLQNYKSKVQIKRSQVYKIVRKEEIVA